MKPFLFAFAGVLVVVFTAAGAVFAVACAATYLDCRGFGRGMDVETRWEFGCYVNTDQGWVPQSYVFGSSLEIRDGKTRPIPIRRAK